MNRESKKRKTNREKGKSPILRYACVHRDNIASVVIASSWQTARIMHLDASQCVVSGLLDRRKKKKSPPQIRVVQEQESTHSYINSHLQLIPPPFVWLPSLCTPLLFFRFRLFLFTLLTHAKQHTHLPPSLHCHPSTTQSRAVRLNPNAMPRTICVLEYDELSTCPYAYPVKEAPYTPLSD